MGKPQFPLALLDEPEYAEYADELMRYMVSTERTLATKTYQLSQRITDLETASTAVSLAIHYPVNTGKFQVISQPFTSPDDTLVIGYNQDGAALTEPVIGYRQEVNYPVTVRGIASTRTVEIYREFRSDPNDSRTIRPIFHSFAPASGGSTGFLNYGYGLLGVGYLQTPGSGGFYWYNEDDANANSGVPSIACGIDFDGLKPRNVNCMVDTYLNITAATAGANMQVTLNSVSSLSPGSNLEFWSVDSAALTNKGFTRLAALASTEIKIVSISGSVVTTNYDNTGGTITTAHKCKRPQTLINTYQGAFQKVGVNRTIPSNSTDVFSVAGPVSFYSSSITLNDASAAAPSQMTFNKKDAITFQCQRFTTTNGTDAAFGFFSTNQAAFGFGAYQSTDASFAQSTSYLSIGANGIGIGGTSATVDAPFRVTTGNAAKGQLQFETQSTAYTGAGSGGILWFDGTNFKYRVGGTTKTITAV